MRESESDNKHNKQANVQTFFLQLKTERFKLKTDVRLHVSV